MRPFLLLLSVCYCIVMLAMKAGADDWPIGPPEPLRSIEMVLVKGGCYQMGDTLGHGEENESPVHKACVGDFYIGKYLVTQMQWTGAVGHNPSKGSACGINCPVENVSWTDVQEFIRKLNNRTGKKYRLPTEAEWEYAGRSRGKEEEWAGTSDAKQLDDYAWYYDNSGFQSHPVGQKKPNELGLYDMTGNVWEWMSDCYDERYYEQSPNDNPGGPPAGEARSLRGGYWGDLARFVRLTRRIGLAPSTRGAGFGFRLAFSAS